MSSDFSFLSGVNAEYIAQLYSRYLLDSSEVDESWKAFFDDLSDDEQSILQELSGASWTPPENKKTGRSFDKYAKAAKAGHETTKTMEMQAPSAPLESDGDQGVERAVKDSIQALMLIRAYRARGHLVANLDPLSLKENDYHPELNPAHYGFTDSDYNRPIFINGVLGMEYATLQDILDALRAIYCSSIGVEFLHLSDPEEKAWIQRRIEAVRNHTDFTINGKRAILQRITAAEAFEQFLHKKYTGTKRFGLDGGEALIPALEQIIKRGGQLGVKEIVLGMSHRGRLNVLSNVIGKPFAAIFSEFQGKDTSPEGVQGSGDVKYHLGTSASREFDGNEIHLSLSPNPSHLEAVNPVVIGKVRAKQKLRGDKNADEVLPVLLHGDAAFAGQGIVAETLMISDLPGYRVGGTIHFVVNNQIGFTTMPQFSRSGPYPTDVAKLLSAPIFHVNGDDPEAVVHVARIASEFRQEFKKDVVLDLFCYRRYGHNEGDEPMFTQPLMYKKIKQHKTTRFLYAQKLIAEHVISQEEAQEMLDEANGYLEAAFEATTHYKQNKLNFLEGAWTGLNVAHGENRRGETALREDTLKALSGLLTKVPESFDLNTKIARQLDARRKMFETGEGIDWATGEALAFGSLIKDGYAVRLSGQDSGRGTFSHRHAILHEQKTEDKYIPLQHVEAPDEDAVFEVHNSPLSEMAVLGFEYGYSLADPNTLVLWEAQFGDFANGAQVIFDQFISSGELKWLRMSGLVVLLPHGYEGQGPEHSSARLERFLQLSAEDNWQVCNCTTPANYFHMLRRQMCRDFRKPLIVMTPKSLLRHKLAVSKLSDFTGDETFHRVLYDTDRETLNKPDKIKRVVLCSGKVYYDLLQQRRDKNIKDIVILRLEQLYPFPTKALGDILSEYKNADVVWCQEEPKNQGAWSFVDPYIEDVLSATKHKTKRARYTGRAAAAAPATGHLKRHMEEQAKLVEEALTL